MFISWHIILDHLDPQHLETYFLNLHHLQDNNSYFIKQIKWTTHEQHVDNIRCGGKECGHDTDDEYRVAAIFFKGLTGADSHLCGKYHKNGKLEYDSECQDKDGDEIHKFADGYHRLELVGLEAKEKLDAIGQGDEIAETCTKIKKYGGKENKPDKCRFFEFKWFAQGHPETVEDSRHKDKQGHKKRKLHMGQKRSGYGEKSQLLLKVILQTGEYCGGKHVKGGSSYDN